MGIPTSPTLTKRVIEGEVLQYLQQAKGLSYAVLWQKILGVHFRNSPENDQRLRQALESLVKQGKILHENGWVALVCGAEGV
jgi:hypothetical protein